MKNASESQIIFYLAEDGTIKLDVPSEDKTVWLTQAHMGDCVSVLLPEDDAKFTKVTYNYYEQLNGSTYLKSLGIGYHFYQDKYTYAFNKFFSQSSSHEE